MSKILIVSPTLGAYGGIEAFILELGRFLREQGEFTARLCLKRVQGIQISTRLQTILKESALPFSIVDRASCELRNEIANADIIHAQNAPLDVSLLARIHGKKLVQTIHNHLYGRGFLRTQTWKISSKFAHRRLYNSRFVMNSWERNPNKFSEVIPTVSRLAFNFASFPKRLGFVFVSRLIANKGADILLEAYRIADIDHQAWPLHLLGDGPEKIRLQHSVENTDLPIHFHGFVSEEEKQKYLAGARWLIAPPNTREDMGLTPLEARAVGVPVIATRDGGLPESAGEHALLCSPGDIVGLKEQIECATRMPQAEYEMRSLQAYESLKAHLVPMDFYPKLYRELLV